LAGRDVAERRLLPALGRGRRSGLRFGSSTVPLEQIGHSATKRLWRQKSDMGLPRI
jgi:hypothetical protein